MKTPASGHPRTGLLATWALCALILAPGISIAQQTVPAALAANRASAAAGTRPAATAAVPEAASALTATAAPQGVLLTWTAPPVKTPRRFEVERSTDGVTFRAVGVVTATENSAYRFVDASSGGGTVYYRLRQPAVGGSGTSAVLTYSPDNGAWQPSPNPATDWLSCGNASGEYRILDAAGRTVLTGRLTPGQRINVRRLRNGNHTLELRTGNQRVARTFLKYAPEAAQ